MNAPGLEGISARNIEANGFRIHLLEAGEGPMVLLCHGFPELAYAWRYQLRALAEAGYHAVAIDMLGYGRSAKPSAFDTRITVQIETFIDVVRACGHETAAIVGHDMGAPRAWGAAWMRPDVFDAVAGVSVPFGGRGSMAWPNDSFSERRPPSAVEAEIAGPGNVHYQEYFARPGALAGEAEKDLLGWLNGLYYGTSARAPLPKFSDIRDADHALEFLRETAIVLKPGEGFSDKLPEPGPDHWIEEEELEFYAATYECTGLEGPLNSYRTLDLDWELLAPCAGKKLEPPAIFIAGEHDLPALWGVDAIARFPEVAARPFEPAILEGLGHWHAQEDPDAFNAALLGFLAEAKPAG